MLRVFGTGEVAFPPEVKQGRAGEFLTFKIRSGKTLPDGRVIQAYTRCVMFGERAKAAAERISEGTMVTIDGELSSRKDDQGREWTSVRVADLGVPSVDAAQRPKTDRDYWRDPGTQPQHASVEATPAPQYSQAPQQQPVRAQPQQPPAQPQPQPQLQHGGFNAPPAAQQNNPYRDDDIPF